MNEELYKIEDDVRTEIERRLCEVENKHDVRIVYAVESGSRAWGFASPDSDYDVRFIYVHKKERYLSVRSHKDVIETPLDEVWDINGWDAKKALALFRKSNTALLEWLQSPIVYRESETMALWKSSLREAFNPRACHHHYWNMAKRTVKTSLESERVKLKKYFYALRPLLACLYIEEEHGVMPTEFHTMLAKVSVPDEVREAIAALMKRKSAALESGLEERDETLLGFINRTLETSKEAAPEKKAEISWSKIDEIFLSLLEIDT